MSFLQTGARSRRLALVPLATLLVFMGVHAFSTGGAVSGDSVRLMNGVGALDHCLHTGQHPCPAIQQWPLLQYLPSLAVKWLGGSSGDAITVLLRLNGLAFLATLALLWTLGRRSAVPGGRFLALLVVLASPLLWYAESTFGEGLATFFVTLFAVGLLLRWHPAIVLAALVGAGISKETALPFLLGFGLIAVRMRTADRDADRVRSLQRTLVAGAVTVAALLIGFNLFRYGTVYNQVYSDPDFLIHSAMRRLDFTAAYLAAPDAGLLFMWPGAVFVIVLALSRAESLRHAAVAAIAVLCVLFAAFSNWWTPFGWIAWGARFSTPWITLVAAIALVAAGASRQREALLRDLAGWRAAVAAGLLIVVLGLGQFGAFLNPVAASNAPTDPDSACGHYPADPETQIAAGDTHAKAISSACAHDRAWKGYGLRQAYGALMGRNLPWTLLFFVTTAGLFAAFTSEARAEFTLKVFACTPKTVEEHL